MFYNTLLNNRMNFADHFVRGEKPKILLPLRKSGVFEKMTTTKLTTKRD